jgi:hypothetical protein
VVGDELQPELALLSAVHSSAELLRTSCLAGVRGQTKKELIWTQRESRRRTSSVLTRNLVYGDHAILLTSQVYQ